MAKTIIRENNVLAIETRTGLFVIAQALKNKTLVIFNLFTTAPQSFDADLINAEFLCCVTPVKAFFDTATIVKLKIKHADGIEHYKEQNHLSFELLTTAVRNVKVYENTNDEVIIPVAFMGELRLVDSQINTLQHLSKRKDIDIIYSHQLDTMGLWGELNERLYLSYRYGKYIEPNKDLIMGNTPLEYKVYYQIIAQQISEDEWMQLPIEEVLY
jgi:hypothetical protein